MGKPQISDLLMFEKKQGVWTAHGALFGGIFGGGKAAGIGSISGPGGLGTTAFYGRQPITLSGGQQMLIRITGA
jgi:hypothetical protein